MYQVEGRINNQILGVKGLSNKETKHLVHLSSMKDYTPYLGDLGAITRYSDQGMSNNLKTSSHSELKCKF